jgi:hypothetical protein
MLLFDSPRSFNFCDTFEKLSVLGMADIKHCFSFILLPIWPSWPDWTQSMRAITYEGNLQTGCGTTGVALRPTGKTPDAANLWPFQNISGQFPIDLGKFGSNCIRAIFIWANQMNVSLAHTSGSAIVPIFQKISMRLSIILPLVFDFHSSAEMPGKQIWFWARDNRYFLWKTDTIYDWSQAKSEKITNYQKINDQISLLSMQRSEGMKCTTVKWSIFQLAKQNRQYWKWARKANVAPPAKHFEILKWGKSW